MLIGLFCINILLLKRESRNIFRTEFIHPEFCFLFVHEHKIHKKDPLFPFFSLFHYYTNIYLKLNDIKNCRRYC
jgi:hypothetical protein